MKESINFTFNNLASEDFGVIIASQNSGLFQDNFLPSRSIIETKTPYRTDPYYQGVELQPLSFSLSFFINEWRDRDNLRQIARWLYQPHYVPMTFETNLDRVFYVILEGESKIIHNGCKDGFIELNFRCNSPYTYSRTREFNHISNMEPTITNVFNDGDLEVFPRLKLTKKVSNGDIKIVNVTTNQIVEFKDIQLNEEIFIDFKTKEIISSLENQNIFRHDNHNGIWMMFDLGENEIQYTGDFDMKAEYEIIYLAD